MKNKTRFIIKLNDAVVGEASTIEGIASVIGCTRVHIYQSIKDNYVTYKKNNYQIIDKLD